MQRAEKFKLINLILVLALSIFLLAIMRRVGLELQSLHVSFSLGFLLIMGFAAGKIFANFSLPQLSGYLFVGIVCGPSFLSLIGTQEIQSLQPINELALALIALQAGSELSLKFLREGTKSITLVILSQCVIIFVAMTIVFLMCVKFFGLNIAESNIAALASAAIFAALSISKAPADTLAILGETKLKGSYANHILGVVVVIDILVIVLFQVVLLLVKPHLVEGAFFDSGKIIHLIEEIGASFAAGVSVGLIFVLWFSLGKKAMRQNILFLILASFGFASMCHYLKYDALIVFVAGGFVVSNLSKKGEELIHAVETLSHGVMIIFFATAGAMLDLQVLKSLWPYALVLSLSRILFTALSTLLGHKLAKDDLHKYRYSFSAYISQAGVTLVLAQSVAYSLGPIGASINALAIAVVFINEIVGPIAFKLAIKREQKLSQKNDNNFNQLEQNAA